MARAADAPRARSPRLLADRRDGGDAAGRATRALSRRPTPGTCLLVDALGTWLAARIAAHIDLLEIDYTVLESQLDREAAEFVDAMLASPADVIAVSEQIGWDVVPVAASARLFRDAMGRMVQRVAKHADRAYLVVAGYALDLRAQGDCHRQRRR